MLDDDLLPILRQGSDAWNLWRRENPAESVWLKGVSLRGLDLSGCDLHEANLDGADLCETTLVGANLCGARLSGASLCWTRATGADFSKAWAINADLRFSNFEQASFDETWLIGANLTSSSFRRARMRGVRLDNCRTSEFQDSAPGYTYFDDADLTKAVPSQADLNQARMEGTVLTGATLNEADLSSARLTRATLTDARLTLATLSYADLSDAMLEGANLEQAIMVRTILERARLSRCRVYGIAAWDLRLADCEQLDLTITPGDGQASITVDDIEVAQFIYLLLTREKLRNVIDTITSRAVLILGRFTPERKAILDAIAEELRRHRLLPIIFDFEGSTERDLTETIKILAGMSLFVIADVSNPKSSPLELQATVPDYQIPFVTIIQEGEAPFAMLDDLKKYDWVLKPLLTYASSEGLRKAFKKAILDRAWAKHHEIKKQKAETMKTQSVEDFLGND